jgi:type II secretory ATPase GspE/PulE/Tfp pilus assembly ATPase PilB-like protein
VFDFKKHSRKALPHISINGYTGVMSQDARWDEERSTERRADILRVQYYDTSAAGQKQLYKDILPIEQMRQYRIIPLSADANNILFGITTTTSQQTMNALGQHFTDQKVTFSLISDAGFRDYMELYDPPQKVEYHDIAITGADQADHINQVSDMLAQVRADDMLAYLVSQAHQLGASDIHLEAMVDDARIRLRIDGVLHPVARLPYDKYRVLISAIASAGNISTSADEAQQGHIAQAATMADGTAVDVNVRLETVPTIHGIDVVMRLFNMRPEMYQLDRLGLNEQQRSVVDEIINKPSGLVLVVGPTGSGKTTTLYSMLNSLVSDERKILTIEDPVEYQFPGISQIPVQSAQAGNDGSFAEKLRAILRLDPDVIMIGEIRDDDTARTALQASLTGHLVLSTFHASTAAAALTRLHDVMKQNPLFVSAIRLVMAQRLVRKLDDSTKVSYVPSPQEMAQLHAVIDTLPAGIDKPVLEGLQLYKPGSSPDNPYGYSGQIAIREQFRMTGEIRRLLETSITVLSAQEIESAAIQSGMQTMMQDAMLRVIAGETSMEEVFRVIE